MQNIGALYKFNGALYQMKNRCLQMAYFPENYAGENPSQGLRDALASWKLCEELQVSITTDN